MSVHISCCNATPGLRRIYEDMAQDIQDKKARDRRFGEECVKVMLGITMKNLERSFVEMPDTDHFAYVMTSTDMPDVDQDEFRAGFAEETTKYCGGPMETSWNMDYRVHLPTGKGFLHVGHCSRPDLQSPALVKLESMLHDEPDWYRALVDDLAREAFLRCPPPATLLTKPKAKKAKKGKKGK